MREHDEKNYFYELLIKAYEGQLSPDEAKILNGIIKSDDQAAYFYAEFFDTVSGLIDRNESAFSFEDNDSTKLDVWLNCLAHDEKEAPAVEITAPQEPKILIQKVQYQKSDRKISKISLFSLFTAAAAIILIFVFAYFAPPATGIKVAVLSDSINAKWAVEGILEKGSPIFTSRKGLQLREGYVKVLYDNQAQVMIEGPAEFQILAEDKIDLRYGKIYAVVPPKAIGFMITTQSAKVIDLGTEFGVQASFDGTTELHVYQGKTTLIAGISQDSKQTIQVIAGKATRTWTDSSQIMDISLNKTLFVREIDSSKHLIWHGQPLDLASVVAGGGGFSSGQTARGIDPATGEINAKTVQALNRFGKNAYRSVKGQSGIDGVFVPNGALGATVVSSAGHTFAFPQTDNMYFADITSYPYAHLDYPSSDFALSLSPLTAGKTADEPLIFIHSSAGITFNLDQIRQSLGNLEIGRFISSCGISYDEGKNYRSEFWVLIDGQCVFHYTIDRDHREVEKIDVSITPQQKFLTLATTNGGDSNAMDWCVFDKPQLVLAKKQQEVSQTNHDAGVEK
jgi:hypothetical protein